MVFGWGRQRRRARLLAAPPPPAWEEWLRTLWFADRLAPEARRRWQERTRVLVAEKRWEGVDGLALEERMTVLIAAQAALLIVNLDNDHYPNVASVLVHPDEIEAPHGEVDEIGIVHEGVVHAGESWHVGFVSLSWPDVEAGIAEPGQGYNVVFHEFAHRLDQETGWMDGMPDLGDRDLAARWREAMAREFERLGAAEDRGRDTFLDPYGASAECEFFAVLTESFFDRPRALRRRHPDLYALLAAYYRQDPAGWGPDPGAAPPTRRRRP